MATRQTAPGRPPSCESLRAIEDAWRSCADLFSEFASRSLNTFGENLEGEVLFCLLGGHGIPYELAASAAEVVLRLDPFNPCWSESTLLGELNSALERPQFGPPRSDGQLRRYRFPARKALSIVTARRWLLLQGSQTSLRHRLIGRPPPQRRELLCQCPGIGPKTASWILRNIGLGQRLAIVDVHVLRALQSTGRVSLDAKLPRDYGAAETAFLQWCRELDAEPAAFDLFVWEWQRGSFNEHA